MTTATVVVNLDPNLAQLGPVLVTWHGILSVLGVLAGFELGRRLLVRDGLRDRATDPTPGLALWDLALGMLILGWIGARALDVWENYRDFAGRWLNVVWIGETGLSRWGGILGALLAGWIWSRRVGMSFWRLLDAAGPACCLGFAVARAGDVVSGAHHGITTTLPWGVQYVNQQTLGAPGRMVQPETTYEMLWGAVILAVLLPLHGRLRARLPEGLTGLAYLIPYGAGMVLLAFLRTDPLVLHLRAEQWAGMLALILAGAAVLVRQRRPSPAGRVGTPR
ncbi:MAG: prolipoprotein diacylglyceryl transferase [Candidatus Dormibacteraceae bacterium]